MAAGAPWRWLIGHLAACAVSLLALALLAAPAAGASEGPQIVGLVTDAVSAVPLSGVEVCAQRRWGEPPTCATTDPGGHYKVVVPWPEEYVLLFKAPKESGYPRLTYFNDRYVESESERVAVPAGGTATANEGLQRVGAITGTVTTKGSGTPIAGLEVCTGGTLFERAREEPCTTSAANGVYTLDELAPRWYAVRFYPGPLNYLPETPMLEYAQYPTVAPGATTSGVDAELIEGGEIAGRITSASSGEPLAGAEACADGFGPSLEDRCVKANANGEYVLAGLETSAYHLFFSFERPYLRESYEGGVTVGVKQGKTITANGALALGGTITGQVRSAATGAVMAGQQVCDNEGTSRFCTTTDSNGEYSLTGIETGDDIVEFVPVENAYQYKLQYWDGQEVYENANAVKVTAGKTTAGVDADLSPRDGAIAGQVSELPGEHAIGHALVCVRNTATHGERCVWTGPEGEYAVSVAAGEYDVRFTNPDSLEPVFPAQYWDDRALASEAEAVTVKAGFTISGIDAGLTAEEPGQISGTVRDASTHAAVGGVEVCALEVEGEDGGLFGSCASSNSHGSYVIDGLGSGAYVVEFSSPQDGALDYLAQYYDGAQRFEEAQLVSVGPGGGAHGVDAELQQGAKIAGTVTDAASAAAVEGEEACAFSVPTETFRCASGGTGGGYTITALPAGEYTVAFFSPATGPLDYVPQYYDDVARSSEASAVPVAGTATTANVDARLQLGGRIEGIAVVAVTGRPLAGVLVCALSSPKVAVECTETNTGGGYVLTGLPAGEYVVGFDPESPLAIQYYNHAATYADAASVAVTAGRSSTGIDAALVVTAPVETPFPTPVSPPRPVIPSPVPAPTTAPAAASVPAPSGGVLAEDATAPVPVAHLALRGSRIMRSGRELQLRLTCAAARCAGKVALVGSSTRVVHGHRRTVEVVLGTAAFDIAPGRHATVLLRQTHAGSARLASAGRRAWRARLLLTLGAAAPSVHLVTVG